MRVVAVESSCDDTAAAVVEDGRRILSSVVASQVELHGPYGGVVPELASRSHLKTVVPVIHRALADAGVDARDWSAIDAVAATHGPGLVGSLLVGLQAAKAIAFARGLPFVGVNHLEGHIHAIFLGDEVPDFPFAALLVSGGHTLTVEARAPGDYRVLGDTRDDAAGEALDKVAKLLGLPYPGGVQIERAAALGDPHAISFPSPLPRRDDLDFSFSGLKTAAMRAIGRHSLRGQALADLCASFQEAVVATLLRKTIRAVRRARATRLVLAGGVAANTRLREAMRVAAEDEGIALFLPEKRLCTDNAAMIGAAAHPRLAAGSRDPLSLPAVANLPLGRRP